MSETASRYIYHYCADCTRVNDRKMWIVDGVLECTSPVRTMEEYREVKKRVAGILGDYDVPVTILSLSLLHTV